jgi:hypothetical protein
MTGAYKLEFFAEDDGTEPVLAWIKDDLTAAQRQAIGTAMRRILQANGVQVCSTPWGRQLGGGLFEFRVRRTGEQKQATARDQHGTTPSTDTSSPRQHHETVTQDRDTLMSKYTYAPQRKKLNR